jgi:hypothetical protein
MHTTRIPFKAIRLVTLVLILTIALDVINFLLGMDFRLLISVEPALELETALGQTSDQDIAINSSSTTSSAFSSPLSSEVSGFSLTKLGLLSGSLTTANLL